ncbi:MAG: hypothetical protein GY845_25230 [Planctomycetes bacterium]|nr:hypothetical protein [Planctomycetota bacterium]
MRRIVFALTLVLMISGAASANGLSKAMDINLIFETGGDADWFFQTTPYFSDYDSVQSGDIGNGQVSWMKTTVYGSGTLSFLWKVSSEDHGDDMQFFIDGVLQDRISETVEEWLLMTYEITSEGSHILEWRYVRDNSQSEGNSGRAWVDRMRWSGGTQPLLVVHPLSEALDTSVNSTTGGEAEWLSQTDTTYFGGDAAKSGNIGDNEESFLQMAVNGTGTISFYWKVCSEADCDFLEFYIDGVLQDRISGLVDWHQMFYTITDSGKHNLEWRYVKDASLDGNDDCGWVDLMEWSGKILPPPPPLATALSKALDTNLIIETGGDVDWCCQTTPYFSDYDAARSGDVDDGQVSWMKTKVYGPGILSFYWKVTSECHGDDMQFFIDDVLQDRISETTEDWCLMTYEITGPGLHTVEWRYLREHSKSEADDNTCVLVDLVLWSGETQPPNVISLSQALDTSLNLTTGGDAEWLSQTDTAYSDGDAAKSGDVGDNQESFLQMAVNGAGTISFYWKVCSEADYDFLEFYIDGVLQDQISGLVDWHQMLYTITGPGTHTLEWRYVKDVSLDGNDDCGWIDLVEWSDGI